MSPATTGAGFKDEDFYDWLKKQNEAEPEPEAEEVSAEDVTRGEPTDKPGLLVQFINHRFAINIDDQDYPEILLFLTNTPAFKNGEIKIANTYGKMEMWYSKNPSYTVVIRGGNPVEPNSPEFDLRKECVLRVGSHIFGSKPDKSEACPQCMDFANAAERAPNGSIKNADGSTVILKNFADHCEVARKIFEEFEE